MKARNQILNLFGHHQRPVPIDASSVEVDAARTVNLDVINLIDARLYLPVRLDMREGLE